MSCSGLGDKNGVIQELLFLKNARSQTPHSSSSHKYVQNFRLSYDNSPAIFFRF